jgi:hypothetical protein
VAVVHVPTAFPCQVRNDPVRNINLHFHCHAGCVEALDGTDDRHKPDEARDSNAAEEGRKADGGRTFSTR